jgi:GT2 family glycosyltransferase
MTQAVTILIPHYRTLPLTQACLGLLQRYTNLSLAKIIVIENDSQDGSLPYLQSLSWIEVIARQKETNETPIESHARALDVALSRVTTPYVLSIHTDTLVRHPDWLLFLLSKIEADPRIAGVGSWKLEFKPAWRRWLKRMEYGMQWLYHALRPKHASQENQLKQAHYLRSHCALYRTALLKQYHLSFGGERMAVGQSLHHALTEAGYQMLFLPSHSLGKYVVHLNHATILFNPELSRRKNVSRSLARLKREMDAVCGA